MVVTIDMDFGELVFLHGVSHAGLVRLPDVPVAERIALMENVLERCFGRALRARDRYGEHSAYSCLPAIRLNLSAGSDDGRELERVRQREVTVTKLLARRPAAAGGQTTRNTRNAPERPQARSRAKVARPRLATCGVARCSEGLPLGVAMRQTRHPAR